MFDVETLPSACFEPINPVLEGENRGQEWIVRWLEKQGWDHHNLRDHQVEAFASSLNGRAMSFSYTVLVTSAGQFLASPARAEEMYAPESFGRSSSATVVVKPGQISFPDLD